MKNIKIVLEQFLHYYETTRHSGHTHTMVDGVRDSNGCIVVSTNSLMSNLIDKLVNNSNVKHLSLSRIDTSEGYELLGNQKPLAFDNSALFDIFSSALQKIEQLETDLATKISDQHGIDCQYKLLSALFNSLERYAEASENELNENHKQIDILKEQIDIMKNVISEYEDLIYKITL